ncbi:MAG: lysine exporter LysO family protein [Firmicutes bacterium]|nr:lysine exporter LysO family protein [Bacillota bacterium]
MIIIVLLSITAGILIGHLAMPAEWVCALDKLSTIALCLLLTGIGIDLGCRKEVFQRLKDMGWRIALVPLLVAGGSIGGAWLAGVLIGLPAREATAIGAGFGWYSLSGVLIAKIYNVETGALAFLTNVMRELMSFILIPLLAAKMGRLAAIAPGGATTMDTTLPLIARATDSDTAVIALVNGTALSALVPFLVPLLINL